MSTNLEKELQTLRQVIDELPPGSRRVHLEGLERRCAEQIADIKATRNLSISWYALAKRCEDLWK